MRRLYEGWIRIRIVLPGCGLVLGMVAGAIACTAQSSASQPAAPAQQDNPFPGATQTAPQDPAANQKSPTHQPPPAVTPAKPSSDNPFPGEDANAPVIPVAPDPSGTTGAESTPGGHTPDEDADPVRSPDLPGSTTESGFSSSRSGLGSLGTEDDGTQGKSKKTKSRKEMFKEDLDVGHFYLDKKNWKAAQERFGAAFALDKEAPEAVWGLAEAERHLEMFDKAREHYELFLSYDPDGPHSRAARKALEQVESIRPAAATPTAGAALPSIAQQPQ